MNILNDIDLKKRKLVTFAELVKRYLMSSATKVEVIKCNHPYKTSNSTSLFSLRDEC